jgi:membrane dipeptidase
MSHHPFIDGHNDLPHMIRSEYGGRMNSVDLFAWSDILQTDLPKLKMGHVGAIIMSAYVQCQSQMKDSVEQTMESIDIIKRLSVEYPDHFEMAYRSKDIKRIFNQQKIGTLIGVEGGHSIDSSPFILRLFYELGARYMTLTHNCDTPWAESCCDNRNTSVRGLTDFGKGIVREMNRLGMMVDLSHTSIQTMKDALAVTTAPIIFSHSNVRSICDVPRNIPDEIIDMIPSNGGIIMVTFVRQFLAISGNVTVQNLMDHINYISDRIGVDYIGVGTDYDGVDFDELPVGLEGFTTYT